jgi:basic membrane lipoprotein Med (substrate-binding protein (PBP1-ABC) superfamily)
MSGFENIEQISNYEYLIGTTDGFIQSIMLSLIQNYKVTISNIVTNKLNENFKSNSIGEEGSFDYDENNIGFNYTVPEYKKY